MRARGGMRGMINSPDEKPKINWRTADQLFFVGADG